MIWCNKALDRQIFQFSKFCRPFAAQTLAERLDNSCYKVVITMMTAGQLIEQPLLAADTGGLESKWEAMDDSLLLQEIANYRDALRALTCRLSTRGKCL
jgi:hypothetical protein